MDRILTEAPVALAVSAWKKQHNGEKPDIESPEFKQFKKEVDKLYNAKQQDKAAADKNVGSYVDTLLDILEQAPQNFPQEFYNALTNLQKKGKVNLCNELLKNNIPGEIKTWVQVVGNLFNDNKVEAAEMTLNALKESSKYPWINGLLNQRLIKEDDFNLDNFDASVAGAGGMDISSDAVQQDASSDSSDTTQSDDNFNLDDFGSDTNSDLHITPAGGSVDSIGMGMGGDDEGVDSLDGVNQNKPTYRVIDVMFDNNDPEAAPKVKVVNMDTGETEIKDIYEIDV